MDYRVKRSNDGQRSRLGRLLTTPHMTRLRRILVLRLSYAEIDEFIMLFLSKGAQN